MSSLLMYSLKSAMVLALLYLPYLLMLRRESFFRFNRMMLLGIMALSLTLPLCNIPSMSLDRQPVVHAAQVQMIELGIPVNMLPELLVTAEPPSRISVSIFMLVSLLYIIGMGMVLVVRLWQVGRLWLGIRRGALWKQEEEGITICCHAEQVMAFSWMDCIVISEQDYNEAGREIILHEMGHIRNGHSWDVLLLTLTEMLQWWNPLVYVLGISLRDVHEYEADDYVLHHGVSAQEYQVLLIKKAVGSGSYAFANNFNHSLTKNRITMMLQKKSNPWMRSKALYVIPVAALALSAFATPKFVTPIQEAVKNLEDKGSHFAPVNQSKSQETATDAPKPIEEADVQHIKFEVDGTPTTLKEQELKNAIQHVDEKDITYIVDGEEKDLQDVNKLPAADITHMYVLRDEASRSIFGPDAKPCVIVVETKDGEIVEKPEVLPEFPGGMNEMFGWMNRNVKYPKEALECGVEGRIIVQFVVEKDGSINDIKVIKGAGEKGEIVVTAYKPNDDTPEEVKKENADKARIALQEEALRVVKTMPKWKPGTNKGKPVRTKFTLPITFRLS